METRDEDAAHAASHQQHTIPNRFSQSSAPAHAADAQRGGEDHVGRMRAAGVPDKKQALSYGASPARLVVYVVRRKTTCGGTVRPWEARRPRKAVCIKN